MYKQLIELLNREKRKQITFEKGYKKKTLLYKNDTLKLIETSSSDKKIKILSENDNISELYYDVSILISGY